MLSVEHGGGLICLKYVLDQKNFTMNIRCSIVGIWYTIYQ